mgnify:CR=1 FL=1
MTHSDTEIRTDDAPIRTAALLLRSRAARLQHFQNDAPDIDDISWHILLDLMVSMKTNEMVTADDLACRHAVAKTTMSRYIEYLTGAELIRKDHDGGEQGRERLTLTGTGDALASDALRKISEELQAL